MPIKWTTEQRNLTDIIPSDYNPRTFTPKQELELSQSIERFNLADPIIINKNNRIIGGHFRYKILKSRNGHKPIDVRVPDRLLNDSEEKELNIRLNKNLGGFDISLLANFDESLLKDIGFDSAELDKIFQGDAKPQDDDVPDERKTNIKRGDIFQLGSHKIMCGDATDPKDIDKLMGDTKADMVFTDPPYNVAYSSDFRGKSHRPIENDNMSSDKFREFIGNAIRNLMAICDGSFYICMSSKELSSLKQVFEEAGGHWQSYIIWVKSQFTLSRADYQNQYEPILYGWNKAIKRHYFVDDRSQGNVWYDMGKKAKFEGGKTILAIGGVKIEIDGKVTGRILKGTRKLDIWNYDKPNKSEDHPTMKPVALCAEAIQNSSLRGGVVVDTFLGSGSTLIACEKTNRICYGMEISETYIDIIIRRWELFTGKKAVKIN